MPKTDKKLRHRPLTLEEAKRRDVSEIENIEKGGPIAMADYTIVNDKSMLVYKRNITKTFKIINVI